MVIEQARVLIGAEEMADRLLPEYPQISRDGRNIVFTVAPIGQKEEQRISSIWVSRDGAVATQFSTGLTEDQQPRWSPDDTKVVFLSDRAKRGTSRIYQIALDGGEALPIGELDGDLDLVQWSPDGKSVGVLRADPETAVEKKKKEDRDDAYVVDREPKLNRLWVVDVESGVARQITHGKRQVWSFAWSPDSSQIAICTSQEPSLDAFALPGDVRTISSTGGVSRLVATFPMIPEHLIWVSTSAGQGIAVRSTGFRDDPRDSVYLVSLESGVIQSVLPGVDLNVDHMAPVADRPDRVVVRCSRGVHSLGYILDLESGALTSAFIGAQQTEGSMLYGPTSSGDGARSTAVWSNGRIPHEVVLGGPETHTVSVTKFGSGFAERLGRVEVVRWQSDEWEIEGLLHYPLDYDQTKRYPLLLEPHGGPSSLWDNQCFLDWHDWAHFMASRGYLVLAPNPRGSTGRGIAFQAALQNDVGGGEVRDLISGVEALVERGIADPERLGIGGWSWGGYLTATTITQTTIFKAAVMGAGLSNLASDHGTDDIPSSNLLYFPGLPYHYLDEYMRSSAISKISECVTPTLIVHGDADARVHVTQGAEMYRALKSLGVPVEFVRYPREPHGFRERKHQIDLTNRISEWFQRWIPAGPA